MGFLKGCLLVAFLWVTCSYSYAQSGTTGIHGKVLDDKNQPAPAATVILLAAKDSSIIRSTPCDDAGLFKFSARPGKYLLLVSKIGFDQSLTGPYDIEPVMDLAVPDISLALHLPQLKEVSIVAQRSYVEVRPGKVLLNVQSSIIAEGNSVAEILKQAPGVHADSRGNLSIIGRQGAMVTIDGKPVNLTGQDLADLLQSMAGNTVQQIELITNPSAKYEAAAGGIINIISKKGINAGTNFTINAGGGYGKYGKATGGLSFNNRNARFNVFGNYNYGYNKTDHAFTTDRTIDYANILSNYNVSYYATQQGYSQNFRVGTDYSLSKKHTIGVLLSGTINDNDYVKNNSLNIANRGVLDSLISTGSKLNRGQHNVSYDINYNGKLDTAGKVLSADVVYNDINRHSSEYIDNNFYNASRVAYRAPLYQQNLSPASIHIWAAKVDYVNPLSKTSQLEAGIKYSKVKSNNDLVFGPKVNGVYTSSPALSSNFIFAESINSGYVNYVGTIGKVNLIAGIRAEQTRTTGDGNSMLVNSKINKKYLDWFPQMQLNYQLNDKNNIDLSFNRGIARAPYEAINPFLYYVDLYDYRSGNPGLLPQYSNKLQLTHTYNKTITTTLYAMVVTNFYDMLDYIQNDSSKVNITTTKNFGTYSSYGAKLFIPATFTSWWAADFLLDASYQRIKAYRENGNLNKGTQDIIFSGTQNFTLTSTLTAQLSGKYESPTFYGVGQFKANYWVNAGISQQVLNKNGTIRLSITDIFNTHRDRDVVKYQNLNLTLYDKVETRIIRVGFTYRFGNKALKATSKHNAGNEDEQNRATGGVAGGTTPN